QFLRRDVVVIDRRGIKYYVRARSDVLGHVAATAKPWTRRWFRPRGGEVVIDAGANIGRFTLHAASLGARVISIEPNPVAYWILRKNLELNRFTNVEALNVGLGDSEGEMELHVPRGFYGVASFLARWDTRFEAESIKVRVVPLDSLTEDLGSIDWLLVDVEGLEDRVLVGAAESLARTRRIIIEVSHGNRDRVLGLLRSSGFRAVEAGDVEEKAQYFYLERG
ncbi:MAG: FkbM family methyltransferase, partial [Conexivisphaera sp.]